MTTQRGAAEHAAENTLLSTLVRCTLASGSIERVRELLDEGGADGRAGWRLLQALVDCRDVKAARAAGGGATAAALLESEWFGS